MSLTKFGFCNTPLWDLKQLWYSDFPLFTRCFEDTVLTWVPCLFLWVFTPLALCTNRKRRPTLPLTFLNSFRYLLSAFLAIWFCVSLGLSLSDGSEPFSYLTSVLVKAATCVLAFILQLFYQLRGRKASVLMFVFWILFMICSLPSYLRVMLYGFDNRYVDVVPVHELFTTIVTFPIICAQFIMTFARDTTPIKSIDIKDVTPFSYLVFGWFTNLIVKGSRKLLTMSDLFPMPDELESERIYKLWDKPWIDEVDRKMISSRMNYQNPKTAKLNPSLIRVIFKIFWAPIIASILLDLGRSLTRVIPAVLLNLVLLYISSDEPVWKGILYALAIFVSNTSSAMFTRQADYMGHLTGLRIRAVLMSCVYHKAQKLSSSSQAKYTVGDLVNLISVDCDKIYRLFAFLPLASGAPLSIVVVMALLWTYLGPSCLAGVAVIIGVMPVSGIIARQAGKLQEKQMELKDQRIKQTNEILNNIKILKLFAWEPPFMKKVTGTRENEVSFLKKFAYVNAGMGFFWTCTPVMVCLFTFMTYVLVSPENILTPSIAFVSLTLFNQMRFSMILIPDFISNAVQTNVSLNRIRDFMMSEELDEHVVGSRPKNDDVITLENVDASWTKNGENTLSNINLSVKPGQLVAIVGRVGCGKSSLLSLLLGDLCVKNGKVDINGSIAYVPQQAWIQNSSIRQNVVFTSDWNSYVYDEVLNVCCMKPDLDIFPGGDMTEIGEKGINLSGGQKQRISIARAIYQKKDLYLLDDPLSAVDAHVGSAIFDKVIGRKGILKHKTRIFVTNSISVLSEVDYIYVLKDGQIVESGTYDSLMTDGGNFAELLKEYGKENSGESELMSDIEEDILEERPELRRSISEVKRRGSRITETMESVRKRRKKSVAAGHDLIQEEKVEVGTVKIEVYLTYLKNMGLFFMFAILLSYAGFRGFDVGAGLWLSAWSEDQPLPDGTQDTVIRNKRIGIYAVLGFCQGMLSFVAHAFLAYGTVTASSRLHNSMLDCVLRAPMAFFDTTPLGRLLNRFSKDVDQLDVNLPQVTGVFLDFFTQILGMIILISMNVPLYLAIAGPAFCVFLVLQSVYLRTLRPVKRLESISRSPVYSHFQESVLGSSSIRAYGVKDIFNARFYNKLDISQNCSFHLMICQRWMSVRMEFIGQLLILALSLIVVLNKDAMDEGTAGLMISYSLGCVVAFNFFIQYAAEIETAVVAAERIDEYTHIAPEGDWTTTVKPRQEWPEKGTVSFSEYGTRYRKGLDLILRDVNLNIHSNEKIGVVGRTGAGKSSLTLALFRIVEAAMGKIFIDDVNISKIGLHDLRSKLTIIPQDPILFNETLRNNLDPVNEYHDQDLWLALERAHVKDHFNNEGLSTWISEGGQNLSVGQRQLVCLARAILRKTKILVLDEATAAVDLETDALIQDTIRSVFKDCTIITIAHRINTIMDSDRVVVMDRGKVAEEGSPTSLLEEADSKFYSLAKEAGVVS